jgi:NAD/NADP octopine/nopaline dehydrogenase, alpha-helical domain
MQEPESRTDRIRVLICGTGSGAHALAGILSTRVNVEVVVLALNAGKVRRWQGLMQHDSLTITARQTDGDWTEHKAEPFMITDLPQEAARGSSIIIFALPAFCHWTYLTSLQPYIENGSVIVGLPGQNGFEFDVRKALGPRIKNCTILNFDSLPWVCRTIEFGKSVKISGTKDRLVGAVQGNVAKCRVADPLACMQRLLGPYPKLTVSGHLLGITLRSINAYSHPPIMYARWKDWNGQPLDSPPLFYQGIDEVTAELLTNISEEVVQISKCIMAEHPGVDLSQVIPMYEWDISYYGRNISDKTNLMTAMRTNAIYQGITHPMVETMDGKYVPGFNHRFLTEDIPFGLVVIRSIAEIAGVPTPHMDEVLRWSQEKLGKEYLVGSRLMGKNLAETRCAQKYGFTTMDDILGYEPVQPLRAMAISAAASSAMAAPSRAVISE